MLAVAALAWRLASGPISLGFLTPYLARALSAPDGSANVSIDATDLAWNRRDDDLDLRIRGVRIEDADGDTRAAFPTIALQLSPLALLHGELVPTAIDLEQPMLRLVVQDDGRIAFASAGAFSPEAESAPPSVPEDSALPWPPWLERLHSVGIHGGQLALALPGDMPPFDLDRLDLTLERSEDRVVLRYSGVVTRDGQEIDLSGDGHYELDHDAGGVTLAFANLSPPLLSELVAEIGAETHRSRPGLDAFFEAVRMPLSGQLRIALADRRPKRLELDIEAGKGKVAVPGLRSYDVTAVRLAAIVDLDLVQLGLLDLVVNLGGPRVQVVGTAADLTGEGGFVGSATVTALPVATLVASWPKAALPGARSWIANRIKEGTVRAAKVHLRGKLADPKTSAFVLDPPRGWLAFDRLAVRFLDTMPPAQGVSGHGSFSADGWDLVVLRQALVGKVALRHAEVDISTPRKGAPRVAVEANVKGPLADVVSLLNREPVRLSRTLGFTPDIGGGSAGGKLGLDLALAGTAQQRRPKVTAIARATAVELRRVVHDASFRGDLRLRLTEQEARVRGSGRLADAPLEIAWTEPLGSRAPRHADLSGRLDAPARAALGFDTSPMLDGTVGVQAKWTQPPTGDGRVDVALDLGDAAIQAAPIAFRKLIGTAGTAKARLVVRAGQVVAIEDIDVRAPPATVTGRAALAPEQAAVRSLDLVNTISRGPGSDPVRLTATLRPDGAKSRVTLGCDDASVWLEATQVRSDWTGGRLDLTGTANLARDAFSFDGSVDVRDVVLNQSPLLAGVLNLTSFSGLRNALTGKKGLRFKRVVSDLVWAEDQLQIRGGAADGPTIRLLLDGTIDTASEQAKLEGTLIPSYYGLNQAAKYIPVLGEVFGGHEKAAWTVEFTVTGPLAHPKIAVKPLTSIAPGILRDMLKRLGG